MSRLHLRAFAARRDGRAAWFAVALLLSGWIVIGCAPAATPTVPAPPTTTRANPTPTRVDAQGTVVPDASLGAPVIVNDKTL